MVGALLWRLGPLIYKVNGRPGRRSIHSVSSTSLHSNRVSFINSLQSNSIRFLRSRRTSSKSHLQEDLLQRFQNATPLLSSLSLQRCLHSNSFGAFPAGREVDWAVLQHSCAYIRHLFMLPSYLFPYGNTDSACDMIGRIRNLPKHSRLHNPGFQRSRLLPRPQRRTMLHQKNLRYRIQFRYLHEHIG